MVNCFEGQRKEYLELLNDDASFSDYFFPDYKTIKEHVISLKNDMNNKLQFLSDFSEWKKEGEIIDADFKAIGQTYHIS